MFYDYDLTMGNPPVLVSDFPQNVLNISDYYKIADYNNRNHGIIDNDFFEWALNEKIEYNAICWFLNDFSGINDLNLKYLIDSLYKKYTIYCDESNNCLKFRFKDSNGKLNVDWHNDFVLGGVIFEGNAEPFDIDDLFASFKLQKTEKDVKLKSIAKYNGENINRLLDIIKSDKIFNVLSTIFNKEIYIHWSTQSILYYAIVDIVDSVLEAPIMINEIKNILYVYAQSDLDNFLALLAQYNYPNINNSDIKNFCSDFIKWIESLEINEPEEDFAFELLRQGIKTSLRNNCLLFLQNNKDKLLIDGFAPLYALRLSNFPNSIIYFDKCNEVEMVIEKYIKIYCNKKPIYDFLESENNRWIQLSDIISGLIGALLAFINANNEERIGDFIKTFDNTQRKNIKTLMSLIKRSSLKNKYFDHMSCNFQQRDRIDFLMNFSQYL